MRALLAAAFIVNAMAFAMFAQTSRQIASIRAEVNAINKAAPKYKKETASVEGISLEGTEATYFTSGRGLKKITARMYGETFRATAELYYSGEEMIFGYRRVERYDGHFAMKPSPKVTQIVETRVYYTGDKAIRVIDGKKMLAESDEKFAEAAGEMKELSAKLKEALDR